MAKSGSELLLNARESIKEVDPSEVADLLEGQAVLVDCRETEELTAGVLPATPAPGRLEWTLMALAVLTFGLVAVAQALFPLWATHPAATGLRVHLSNGLYVNATIDRLLGGWSVSKAP